MNKNTGIKIGKVALKNKKVRIDFKKIFTTLSKAAIMAKAGKGDSAYKELVSSVDAFSIKAEPTELAYNFILSSLVNAAHSLFEENQWKFKTDLKEVEKLYDHPDYMEFLEGITAKVEEKEIIIDADFLQHPRSLPILDDFTQYLNLWLTVFGLPKKDAELITNRFPTYFIFALNDSWRKNYAKYEVLAQQLNTPLTEAARRELQWMAYNSYLQWQLAQPIFEEAFCLKDVFVDLRAYYEEQTKSKGRIDTYEEKTIPKKVVVKIQELLDQWLNTPSTDAIKIISGGPGSGKSSFCKYWAAQVAEQKQGSLKVLFIPLHLFDIHSDIKNALGDYLKGKPDIPLDYNPLEQPRPEDQFLLIFDGLDELVMQGKTSREAAIDFIDELKRLCDRVNEGKNRLKILIAGRPIPVQNAESKLRGSQQQIIHLLPYYIPYEKHVEYEDENQLLIEDQRNYWWNRFFVLKSIPARTNLPQELVSDNLDKLTAEPLLNYLVALSWQLNPKKFHKNINTNEIYYQLMEGVFNRDYVTGSERHRATGDLEFDDFLQILEEIAVCAWHGGDVRVTSERKIEKHIKDRGLQRSLEAYKASAKGGVSRLLTAFYFRKFGKDEHSEDKDETFEFTHKSFGEYLTARALVELVQQTHAECTKYLNNKNYRSSEGWSKQQALEEWLRITGQTTMDDDLFHFIKNEVQLRYQKRAPIYEWQLSLCELIGEVLITGMPFTERKNNKEEIRLARNAEECLLVLLSACARVTNKTSPVRWENPLTLSNWLARLSTSLQHSDFTYQVLNNIEAQGVDLMGANLMGANLMGADLSQADLKEAKLKEADLKEADLKEVDLRHADLRQAKLMRARLMEANLKDANLMGARLMEAKLKEAKLSFADLRQADLSFADLSFADLSRADLSRADLRQVDLRQADLRQAKLMEVKLMGADLSQAKLMEANLMGANLMEANLMEVRWSGADLRQTDLRQAKLRQAKLRQTKLGQANLSFADLKEADLSLAKLTEADLREADLREAKLTGADLSRADLSGAKLSFADLSFADLREAKLSFADLRQADLSGAKLRGAQFHISQKVLLQEMEVDFSEVKFLDHE